MSISEVTPALVLVQFCLLKKPSAEPTQAFSNAVHFLLTASVFLLDFYAIMKTTMNEDKLTIHAALEVITYSNLAIQVIDQRVFFNVNGHLLQELLDYFKEKTTFHQAELQQLEQETMKTSKIIIRKLNLVGGIMLLFLALSIILPISLNILDIAETKRLAERTKNAILVIVVQFATEDNEILAYLKIIWLVVVMIMILVTLVGNAFFAASLMIAIAGRANFLRKAAPRALFSAGDDQRRHRRSMPVDFTQWVRYQQRYISQVHKMNQILGGRFFIDHLCSLIRVISLLWLQFNCARCKVVLFPVLLSVVLMVVTAFAGQRIIDQSKKMYAEVAYIVEKRLRLVNRGPYRSNLKTILARCLVSGAHEKINGNGFFEVSKENFYKEIGFIWTCFLALYQISGKYAQPK